MVAAIVIVEDGQSLLRLRQQQENVVPLGRVASGLETRFIIGAEQTGDGEVRPDAISVTWRGHPAHTSGQREALGRRGGVGNIHHPAIIKLRIGRNSAAAKLTAAPYRIG